MALTFRDGLGRALTHTELDTNFRELYYSSSYTSHSISLFKSKSLNAETILPVNQARGSKYSIQVKSGSEALGTGSIATGSSYFLWNYNQKKLIVTGSGNITGDLTVGGTVFAQEFKAELISSSIIFDSGSTKFGDSLDDFHDFTGSVSTTGSGALFGNYTQTGNNTTVGKLELTGSNLHLGNTTRIGNTTLTGVLQSTGNTILSGSTHTVTGNVTHVGNVNQTGNTTINGSILHTGSLTHSGSISINSTGNVTLTGGVTQTGLLTRTGETQLTGNLKVTGSGVVSSNLQVAGNLQVNGTGSFGYVQTITGSAKVIGDAFIILNNNTPTARYAGVKVIDSGSSNVTASLQFDGLTNDWFQEYEGGTDDHKAVLFGPSYPTKGTPIYPVANQIQKGTGNHHLTGSNITDDGSTVTITSGIFAIPGITNVSASLAAAGGGGSSNVVDDTAPKLGGNLDINTRTISGSGGININGNITGLKITGSAALITGDIIGSHIRATNTITGSNILATANISAGSISAGPTVATSISSTGIITGSIIKSANSITGSSLLVNGPITATGDITAFFSSDERLKDNVTPIANPIEKLKSIGGYEFDWNSKSDNEGHDVGVIAQEIESILPEIVVDRDNGYKAVRYEKIVALLIEAIKEQQSQIDELKSKL